MKKISVVLAILFALSISVFFGACGGKYDKLKIYYDSENSYVQLIIDDEYWDTMQVEEQEREKKNAKTVKVTFDGIKKKHIGDLDIKVIPSDLAEIEENEVIEKTLHFNVYASRPGIGEIQVTHLSSGKFISIPLYVDKKAYGASGNGNGIVLNFPKPNEDETHKEYIYTIDPNSVLQYAPFDATDNVIWEIVGTTANNVEIGMFDEVDETSPKIPTQIKITSENATEETFYITPTLSVDGYEDKKLADIKVPVSIARVIDEDNLRVLSPNAITTTAETEQITNSTYKIISDPIYLFHNSLEYGNAKLYLYSNEQTNVLQSTDYMRFYECNQITKSSSQIDVKINTVDNCIDVVGLGYNENLQWFEITFTPKNCVGDIKEFKIRQEIILTEVASRILINMDGESLATTDVDDKTAAVDIDLLDYYAKYGDLGQKFNFAVYKTITHTSLKKYVRIVIDSALLSSTSAEHDDDNNYGNHTGSNNYLLQFKLGNNELRFDISQDGNAYSEWFSTTSNIYAKYVYNEEGSGLDELTFKVRNVYDGSLGEDVELGTSSKDLIININRGRGIKSMSLYGAYVAGNKDSNKHDFQNNGQNSMFVLNSAIADGSCFSKINSGYAINADTYVYGINISGITGATSITSEEINEIDFNYAVYQNGKQVDLFDFAIFSSSENTINFLQGDTFNLVGQTVEGVNVLLILKKDGVNIPNAEYQIEISEHIGGFKARFTYNVVTNVSADNADVTPFNISDIENYRNIYTATEYRNYLFDVLDNEFVETLTEEQILELESYLKNIYIVPTNQNISTMVRLGKFEGANFTIDDSYAPYVSDISVSTEKVSLVYNEETFSFDEQPTDVLPTLNYISNDVNNLVGNFKFDINLKTGEYGTIYNKEKYFIKINYHLYSDKYDLENNFYKKTGVNEPAVVSYYFFIYVDLGETKFEQDASIINTYFYEDLGYYFQEEGKDIIQISLPNKYGKSQSVFDYVDYKWEIGLDDLADFNYTENKENHSLTFMLEKLDADTSYRDRIIKATITQFGVKRTIVCTVHVNQVKLTEKIVVRNPLQYLDATKNHYVYLKEGGNFKFDVEQVGASTFEGVKYVVCDLAGKVSKDYRIDAEGNLIKIGSNDTKITDLKVLIFSADWVIRNLESEVNVFDFTNLSEYTFIKNGVDYSKRVQVIDVKIRDGSRANPYLIANLSDFKDINNDLNAYYEIVYDINLNGEKINIATFNGNLTSYKDYKALTSRPSNWANNYKNYYTYSSSNGFELVSGDTAPTFVYRKFYELNQNVYTVYNISFNDYGGYNLIDELSVKAEISNVNFRLSFNNAYSNVGYIGLIAKNYGTLKNVKVEYSGNLTLKEDTSSNIIYVGMLVAVNYGSIIYDNANTTYSTGTLNIIDKTFKEVYIGGLVGKNTPTTITVEEGEITTPALISGVLLPSDETVEYALYYENQGSLFDGNIIYAGNNGNNARATLGGVVGYNNGYIKQVFTSGKLVGYNNVGGLIGKNANTLLNVLATSGNSSIVDCLSTTQIIGNNYVGGITGYDENGSYYHTYYEVYNNKDVATNDAYAIKGVNYVGGLIGKATLTQLNYCYFHSFRWDYTFEDPDETNKFIFAESEFTSMDNTTLPDIKASNFVGGLIGYADSKDNNDNNAVDVRTAVFVTNSVADAYITAVSYLGGLIGYGNGYPIVTNAYVQGAFTTSSFAYQDINVYNSGGTKLTSLCKTNYYTNVFGVTHNEINDSYSLEYITENSIVDTSSNPMFKAFIQDGTINNGKHYIELEERPLITQAPTSINLDEALITIENRSTNLFNSGNIDDDASKIPDKILIYYYNLINNNQANYSNDSLSVNIINLDDIVEKAKIKIMPQNTGARIKVTSSNEKVITISASGYVKLVGEGESVLTFASLINPTIYDRITVIVRAMPSDYNIYKNSSKNEELDNSSISIVKGESKFIYEDYIGKTIVNGTEYLYNTTNDVAVFAEISNNDGKILINGKVYDADNVRYEFVQKEPIIISVQEFSEENYTITMSSYIKIELDEEVYYVKVLEEVREFEIITKRGITEINTNITDAVMSVADSLNVDLRIKTDTDINIVNINVVVRDEQGDISIVRDNSGNEIDVNNLFTYNFTNQTSFEIGANGLNEFVLQLNQNLRIEKDLFATITFSAGKVKSEMYLTLIPQKISSIVANAYKQDKNSWKSSVVIRPNEAGIITINVSPDTAYFEYLEITDTYSNEKISFIQWSEFNADIEGFGNGKALNEVDKPSSDGFGIRLVKTEDKTFYVHALLSLYATSNDAHRIMITAYSSTGFILGSSYIDLEAMMFPSVTLSYYNENDQVEIYHDSRESFANNETDLAVGVQAKIGVTTNNADSSVPEWEITVNKGSGLSSLLDIQLSQNGYWYLNYNQNITSEQIEDLVGATIVLKAIVQQVTKGFIEKGVAELKFNLKRFTLNGITAQTARETSGNRLGGIINEETFIEFYFNNTHNRDISYYENGEYFNKNYFVDFNETNDKINDILKSVNNFNTSENVTIRFVHNQNKDDVINLSECLKDKAEYTHIIGDVQLFKITKNNNELTKFIVYSSSMNNYSLDISIKYHYDSTGNVVLGSDNNGEIGTLVLNELYGLNFVTNSSPKDYYPIKNSEEFMNMVAGQYYILYNDITLTNYQMLDINLGGLDGNGHTITIENFDYESLSKTANGTVGYLGLFKQIYYGEIVENLTVEYKYGAYPYDLSSNLASDNTDYTSFYFGGISAINAGIITNCEVVGKVKLTTSKISPANFYLGGLVSENQSTGYITNSTIKLTIEAGAIIGGVATNNQGKIVSTNFVGVVKAYTDINTSLSNEINAAMFVVRNSGEISMCYVAKDNKLNSPDETKSGVINSGGSLGGFVYTNSGKIYDCYLKDIEFSSRGYMGGFVYTSTGIIERCYVDAASSLQGNRYTDIFVYDKTIGTFKDCFYILTEKFNSGVEGIRCITELDMLKESHYTNFAFSTNGNNVWFMTIDGPILPKCGATQYVKNITIKVENGIEDIEYSILGTKENPYVIYDLDSFNYWFNLNEGGVIFGYFRFVADIDFVSYRDIPISSKYVFSGSIEGNNMILSNFSIYTGKDENQNNGIGLFKEIRHTSKDSFVTNLTLNCESVRASTTTSVGVLAGVIDGGNVYSVTIDNSKLVVLGRNAVGGLAGIIKGSYSIENIVSNVSANASFRQNLMSKVNVYNGKYNFGSEENNIEQVSYAGSIAGIVEGYDYRANSSVTINNYYAIRNCKVLGNIALIGETVGGAFGFVSERSRVSNLIFEVGETATFKGVYYSGGLVGENRGIIDNSKVVANTSYFNLFDVDLTGSYATVNGGITAVNYGGLIYNCTNNVNVVNMYTLSTVGGITGRNVGGSINNCANTGTLYGFFAGNIAGSDYTYETMLSAGNSVGTITASTILALNRNVDYTKIVFADNVKISNGYVVSLENLDAWFKTQTTNISLINKSMLNFYSYDKNIDPVYLTYSRVLGAVVGITDKGLEYNTTTLSKELADTENPGTKITKDIITSIDLKNGENVFIKVLIPNDVNAEDLKELGFISNKQELGEEGNKHSELQDGIKNGTITNYYYLIPVKTETYDFYNLTVNGYKDDYVKVISLS